MRRGVLGRFTFRERDNRVRGVAAATFDEIFVAKRSQEFAARIKWKACGDDAAKKISQTVSRILGQPAKELAPRRTPARGECIGLVRDHQDGSPAPRSG